MDEFKDTKYNKNINDVKSSFITKIIFSFLIEKNKLNIIIYNKELQKKLSVDINNYKKISGKYKIEEKNGKGREYKINNNKLIFEGEYLNKKRNGKGKEYYFDDTLKFEGEYLDGKIWNGKGYNINGILEFEIKNGNGKVKEYNYKDSFKFEGEYINGKKWKRKRIY